jgi:16S rRNA processing protein RimM
LRGQVVVNLETDFPEERFRSGAELYVKQRGQIEAKTVVSVRFHHGRPIVALSGVDGVDAAGEMAGAELRVPVSSLAPLEAGTFYRHDLCGCAVETVDGQAVGIVTDVEGTLAGSRLVVASQQGEVLVPLAEDICRVVDPAAKRIVIAPPDGLLELNRKSKK